MDGGAASIVNSTIRISQIVYEFKAVGEQARDLLASTAHVNKAIETTRELRRQKSAYLATAEKQWIDSTIVAAERTLNNVASLVEPVRVDMQTKFGKIGLVNRGLFVFRDSPKVLTHLNQLSMTHVSLVNALSTLSQRQAEVTPQLSPILQRTASRTTLSGPPTYEESEFLNRRRGKIYSASLLPGLEEDTGETASSVDEAVTGSQSSQSAILSTTSPSSSITSPGTIQSVDGSDEKCLASEYRDSFACEFYAPTKAERVEHASPAELEGDITASWGRQRPWTYQAWDPHLEHLASREQGQRPRENEHAMPYRPYTRHSESSVARATPGYPATRVQSVPTIICSSSHNHQGDELHLPLAAFTAQSQVLPPSSDPIANALRPRTPNSPPATASIGETLRRQSPTPTRFTVLPYPDDPSSNSTSSFSPTRPTSFLSPNETNIGLGVTLPSSSPHPPPVPAPLVTRSRATSREPEPRQPPLPAATPRGLPRDRTQSYPSAASYAQHNVMSHHSLPHPETPPRDTRYSVSSSEGPSSVHEFAGYATSSVSEPRTQSQFSTYPQLRHSVSNPMPTSSSSSINGTTPARTRRYAWLEHQSSQGAIPGKP